MKSISEIEKEHLEETKRIYYQDHRKAPEEDKSLFIHWYVINHNIPVDVIIFEIATYYLNMSKEKIKKII